MKIKNLIVLLALFSAPVFAKTGFYVGADFTFENDIEYDDAGEDSSFQNDSSVNLFAGYETQVKESVSIIAEIEYSLYGEATRTEGDKVEGRGLFLNFKPVFYEENWYLSVIAGIGDIKLDYTKSELKDDSKVGYQLGGEFGYRINDRFSVGMGYKMATADFDDYEVRVGGFYTGARFHF